MGWLLCHSTCPRKKIPNGVTYILTNAFFCFAHTISENSVTITITANTDQTLVTYATNASETYIPRGSKQVEVVRKDEGQGFTLVVGISMSGDALPLQAIYAGNTPFHCHHQMPLITSRLLRSRSSALSLEVKTTGQHSPPCRAMSKISLCHTLKTINKITVRSAFGRLIIGLFISQQSFMIGCITTIHGSGFIMSQQIALVPSSYVMLEFSEFLSLQSSILPSRTSSMISKNSWILGLYQA